MKRQGSTGSPQERREEAETLSCAVRLEYMADGVSEPPKDRCSSADHGAGLDPARTTDYILASPTGGERQHGLFG
ncbi:hypothetical protein Chor_011636 [Crotalus horridus]